MNNIRLPGIVWSLGIVALVAFLHANFPNAVWYDMVLAACLSILRILSPDLSEDIWEIIDEPKVTTEGQVVPQHMADRTQNVYHRPKMMRILFG